MTTKLFRWSYILAPVIWYLAGSFKIQPAGTANPKLPAGQLLDSLAWMAPENKTNLEAIYQLTAYAEIFGLDVRDYNLPVPSELLESENATVLNLRISDVATQFFKSLAYGTRKPTFDYDGLGTEPNPQNIALLLKQYFETNRLQALADSFNKGCLPLINKMTGYSRIMRNPEFKEVLVASKKTDLTNKMLIQKLYQLGFLSDAKNPDVSELKKAIINAQKSFDLIADGSIRSTFIEQLNVTLSLRYQQCKQAVNDLRWIRCLTANEEIILVNIPGAFLEVYRQDAVVINMRMVVGKPSTATPSFTTRIQEVVLYPYWHVPRSIATKELLPLIKLDPSFIDKGGYQVLNARGQIMDPYRINWKSLSSTNFPYLIRQSTGCDNALGLLKLNFFTPFGVYLHDTPSKSAFSLHRRYFSHGCMRMEKPMELGRMILKENSMAIDTLSMKGCLVNQAPVVVKVLHKLPLVVWYNIAAIDTSGIVIFYEDVYKKFK